MSKIDVPSKYVDVKKLGKRQKLFRLRREGQTTYLADIFLLVIATEATICSRNQYSEQHKTSQPRRCARQVPLNFCLQSKVSPALPLKLSVDHQPDVRQFLVNPLFLQLSRSRISQIRDKLDKSSHIRIIS